MRRTRKIKLKLNMVHVNWLLALLLSVAVTVYATIFLTEKYIYETVVGQLTEVSIANNRMYFTLMRDLKDQRYKDARTRLEKLVEIEVKQLVENRKRLEDGYFTGINYDNRAAIEKINHYLSDADTAKVVK